jgi:hypothetical protein
MIKRIYVPNNFPVPEILGNIEFVCKERGYELIKVEEKICREHFLLNRGSLALLSPIGYGMGLKSADFRIIPTNTAGLVGFGGKASLYFKSGLSTLDKIGCNHPDDFMMVIGNILLSERYEIHSELEKAQGSVGDILKGYSAAMAYGIDENFSSMDISEDWFETFEIPLPLGFWVVRNEEEPEDVIELTRAFAMDDLPEEIEVEYHHSSHNDNNEREGRIITHWNGDIATALEQTLELLYYHKILQEIPAVKIYGRN